jgi:hypothetical protein
LRNVIGPAFGFAAVAALLGCDARVGEDYRGESLLKLQGKLVIDNPDAPSELIPALGFMHTAGLADGTAGVSVLEVDASGEFPGNFTLDVMLPPPAAVMMTPVAEDLPAFTHGFITAVTPEHPDVLHLPLLDGGGSFFSCPGSGSPCTQTIEQCIAGTDECYRAVRECDQNGLDCQTVEESGDPNLIKSVYEHFAGLSVQYTVLYFADAAPAGNGYLLEARDAGAAGVMAAEVFRDRPVPAGYHLIRTRELDEEEQAHLEVCDADATAAAFAKYNAAHGTAHATVTELAAEISAIAGEANVGNHPLMTEFHDEYVRAAYATHCPNGRIYERIVSSDEPIELVIGTQGLWVL